MLTDYDDLTDEQVNGAIEDIARHIVRRRLETPAILLLEMHKPVSFIASQALVVGTPFLGPLLGVDRLAHYGSILHDRANLDRLIQRIDELAAARDHAAKETAR